MTVEGDPVLVFPRQTIHGHDGFVPWVDADSIVRTTERQFTWLDRAEAEHSDGFVQAISCALIRSPGKKYCALRRIRTTRRDLRSRISLVVGGHVDKPASSRPLRLLTLLRHTLERELEEEIGIRKTITVEPIGILIDSSSSMSSRHIAFLHEVVVAKSLTPQAPEEFSSRSKFSGRLFTAKELAQFRKNLDPWSLIAFQSYIAPLRLDLGRQSRFSLDS